MWAPRNVLRSSQARKRSASVGRETGEGSDGDGEGTEAGDDKDKDKDPAQVRRGCGRAYVWHVQPLYSEGALDMGCAVG